MKNIKMLNYLTIFIATITVLSIAFTVIEQYIVFTNVNLGNCSRLTQAQEANNLIDNSLDANTNKEKQDIYDFVSAKQAYEVASNKFLKETFETYYFEGVGTIKANVKVCVCGVIIPVKLELQTSMTLVKYKNGNIFKEVVVYIKDNSYNLRKSFKLYYQKEKNTISTSINPSSAISSDGVPIGDYGLRGWHTSNADNWMQSKNCYITTAIYDLSNKTIEKYTLSKVFKNGVTEKTIYPVNLRLNSKATVVYGELLQEVISGYAKEVKFTKSELSFEVTGDGEICENIKAIDEYNFDAKVNSGVYDAHIYFSSEIYFKIVNSGEEMCFKEPIIA